MSAALWMPFYVGDYIADTQHLTTEEHGAYILLICAYWRRGSALPDDNKWLAAVTKTHRQGWANLRKAIEPLFEVRGGAWHHKRIEKELLRSSERSASASANAKLRHSGRPASTVQYKEEVSSRPLPEPPKPKVEQPVRSNEVLALCDALKPSPATDASILVRFPNELVKLRAEGLDLERHILPAAREAIAKGAKVKSLNYLRPRAAELLAAETSRPSVDYIPTDDDGWRKRIRTSFRVAKAEGVHVTKAWGRSWGPRPGQPGCDCPPEILQAEGYPT